MNEKELLESWQEAYTSLNHHALVGKLFSGTIHNLNGVIQAFSMQTELFGMMFNKLNIQLEKIEQLSDNPAIDGIVISIKELLAKRQNMVAQMEEKVQYSQVILKNTSRLMAQDINSETIGVKDIIERCIAFFSSDMFFKHKLTVANSNSSSVHVDSHTELVTWVLLQFIENSLESLKASNNQGAMIIFDYTVEGNMVKIRVEDNGLGVPDIAVFEPFTSSDPNRNGLGLYIGQQMATACGGEIVYLSNDQQTVFTLSVPVN